MSDECTTQHYFKRNLHTRKLIRTEHRICNNNKSKLSKIHTKMKDLIYVFFLIFTTNVQAQNIPISPTSFSDYFRELNRFPASQASATKIRETKPAAAAISPFSDAFTGLGSLSSSYPVPVENTLDTPEYPKFLIFPYPISKMCGGNSNNPNCLQGDGFEYGGYGDFRGINREGGMPRSPIFIKGYQVGRGDHGGMPYGPYGAIPRLPGLPLRSGVGYSGFSSVKPEISVLRRY